MFRCRYTDTTKVIETVSITYNMSMVSNCKDTKGNWLHGFDIDVAICPQSCGALCGGNESRFKVQTVTRQVYSRSRKVQIPVACICVSK